MAVEYDQILWWSIYVGICNMVWLYSLTGNLQTLVVKDTKVHAKTSWGVPGVMLKTFAYHRYVESAIMRFL